MLTELQCDIVIVIHICIRETSAQNDCWFLLSNWNTEGTLPKLRAGQQLVNRQCPVKNRFYPAKSLDGWTVCPVIYGCFKFQIFNGSILLVFVKKEGKRRILSYQTKCDTDFVVPWVPLFLWHRDRCSFENVHVSYLNIMWRGRGHLYSDKTYSMFVWPKMGCVWAKRGLTGQFDRCQPGNYLRPWNFSTIKLCHVRHYITEQL